MGYLYLFLQCLGICSNENPVQVLNADAFLFWELFLTPHGEAALLQLFHIFLREKWSRDVMFGASFCNYPL